MSIPTKFQLQKEICDAYEAKGHTSSALHGHYHFLLTLITRGRGVQTLNGKDIPFSEGDMSLLSPADFHKNAVADGEEYDYYGVKFPYKILDKRLSGLFEFDRLPISVTLSRDAYKTAKEIFERLIEECENGNGRTANEIYLQNMVEQLVIIALREFPKQESDNGSDFLNRSLGYLYSHFFEDITVSDVAEYIGYTTNYFNFKFKEAFGMPFGEYLRDVRLSYSKNLLKSSDISITEIALESGFGNSSYFSRAFKLRYGVSPKSYRAKYKKKDN